MNPSNEEPQTPPNQVTPPPNQPQYVYMTRPLEPHRQQISPEIQQKHEESRRLYPKLNLSQGEYIISAIKRHPIGLISIWGATSAVIIALMVAVGVLASLSNGSDLAGTSSLPIVYLAIPALLLSLLAVLFASISTMVYRANEFYLTNESVIQHIQLSLFSQREQTISLSNIEDASFSQSGMLSHLFNYGLLRLSTQGDETTYRFMYASSPSQQIALLNNAVEDFKNVRPMED